MHDWQYFISFHFISFHSIRSLAIVLYAHLAASQLGTRERKRERFKETESTTSMMHITVSFRRAVLSCMAVSIMVLSFSSAFSPMPSSICRRPPAASFGIHSARHSALFSQETPQEPEGSPVPAPSVAVPSEPEGTSFPINLPSPLLLSASMGLAIVSTGSIFELAGGHPQFGFAATCAAAAVGVPLCFFLFYAAIRKGTAETEEDDKRFLGGK